MAYGTPATPGDVEAYYTHVRRGRPPTPELLDDLVRRYQAIRGTSPVLARTGGPAGGAPRDRPPLRRVGPGGCPGGGKSGRRGPLVGCVAERRAYARAVDRAQPARGHAGAGRGRYRRCAGLSGRLRFRSPRGAVR